MDWKTIVSMAVASAGGARGAVAQFEHFGSLGMESYDFR